VTRTWFVRRIDVATALRACVCAVVCAAVTSAAQSSSPVFPAPTRPTVAPPLDAAFADGSVVFRLGDAGAPFRYSTVVGDFNTDGRPDVAVADHVGNGVEPYEYRLQFSVSGQPVRDITFEASQEAIDLRLADVDRDDDLDLIVGEPLSGETLAVWLNDGHGHFTQGSIRDVATVIAAVAALTPLDSFSLVDVAESPTRLLEHAVPADDAILPPLARQRLAAVARCLPRSALTAGETNPRAPPAPRPRPLMS